MITLCAVADDVGECNRNEEKCKPNKRNKGAARDPEPLLVVIRVQVSHYF